VFTLLVYYSKQIFTNWIALVGAFLAILPFFQPIVERAVLKKAFPIKLLWVVGFACIFFAGFQAWHDEYAKTHPDLKLEIEGSGLAENGGVYAAVVLAGVSNLGAVPSIAEKWTLKIQPALGATKTIDPMWIRQDIPIELHTPDGKSLNFSSKDALYLKADSDPIPSGGKRSGILFFPLAEVPASVALNPRTRYQLGVHDVMGNLVVSGVWRVVGELSSVPFVPGIEPLGPPTTQK
jgi:hypothetical protein